MPDLPPTTHSARPHRVAVIGAGPSGLVVLKTLRELGLSAEGFEAGERVGGQWVLNNTGDASACYRSVVANTARTQIHFSDFWPDDEAPDYYTHTEMAGYFQRYAEHFQLLESITFGTRITRAQPTRSGGWDLATDDGPIAPYDALVVATGRFGKPVWPSFNSEFDGPYFHSNEYIDFNDPIACRNKTVLVIGLGNTACDLAVELAEEGGARRVLLSTRSGRYITPRYPFGRLPTLPHPADQSSFPLRLIPISLRKQFMRVALPQAYRALSLLQPTLANSSLPKPTTTPNPGNIVANDHLLTCIQTGAIEIRPAVRSLQGSNAVFVDNSEEAVDVVIAATGYELSHPFFEPSLQKPAAELQLYRGIEHPTESGLFYAGLLMGLCASWPLAESQARWIAGRLTGVIPNPSTMERTKYTTTPVTLSRGALNCQLVGEELRQDEQP